MGTSAAESSQMKGGRWKRARNRRGVVVHQAGKTEPRTTVRMELIRSHRIVGNGTSSRGFGLCRSGLESPALPLVSRDFRRVLPFFEPPFLHV